jgi:dTMP kinase
VLQTEFAAFRESRFRQYDTAEDMSNLRGKFIVLDGGEGCGKSTQMALLAERLAEQGLEAIRVHDPGATPIGEKVRAILLNPENSEMSMRCEMLLYMSARAQLMFETILPALRAGKVVICDRFVSSTLAYQLGGDELTADEIVKVADIAIKGRWPDVTIILDMPIEASFARVRPKFSLFPDDPEAGVVKDRIEQRPREYHEQVRQNYLSQAKAHSDRYRVIPADRSQQEVHEEIWRTVNLLK